MRLDIIGDVHGRKRELESLLAGLGYSPSSGVWRNKDRKAVFIGDLVDRGEDVPGVLAMVKAMVDDGQAYALLGNHEFNLLCWYTPDGKGGYLRERSEGNARQIERTRPFFDANPVEREMYLGWFRRLPVTMELGGARFVHAYWGPSELGLLGGRNALEECEWGDPEWRRKPLGVGLERLIKGPEFRLPDGCFTVDREGGKRRKVRAIWWKDGRGKSIREMVLPYTPELPEDPLPGEGLECFEPYGSNEPPVFFGHYGFNGFPGLLAPNVACVDYRKSEEEKTIGAYRWDGEQELDEMRFVRMEGDGT